MPDEQLTSAYLSDILQQPAALQATDRRFQAGLGLGDIPRRVAAGEFRRIVLTGMGSSYHVLYPLFYSLVRCGLPAMMMETSELLHHAPALLETGTLVVAVSQSGRSAEIVRLLDTAGRRGMAVLGVTNSAGSPLDRLSTACLRTEAGEEATVSCKTYVCSLLALQWLAAALTGATFEAVRLTSALAADAAQAYLTHWRQHVAGLVEQLAGLEQLFLAGRGSSLAACGTGGLIIKESTHVHAEGMSSAALRHGPFEMLSAKTFVLVFAGEASTRALNAALYEDLRVLGVPAGWVDTSNPGGAFNLPLPDEALRPILEILPVEMITLALARLRGRTAGNFERATKVTTIE